MENVSKFVTVAIIYEYHASFRVITMVGTVRKYPAFSLLLFSLIVNNSF